MMAIAEMLKATEAAVVSRVSLREVNRVIDEHITMVVMCALRHVG